LGGPPTFQSNQKILAVQLKFEQLKPSIFLSFWGIFFFFSFYPRSKNSFKNFLHFLLKTIADTQSFGYF